jgi:hypothetical protein
MVVLPQNTPDRDVLNAARMALFLWVPETVEAKSFSEDMCRLTFDHENLVSPRTRRRKDADQRSFRSAVGVFAADLVHHSKNLASEGFCYRPSNREAMAETLVSSDAFDKLVAWWKALALIETTGSIQVRETFEGELLDFSSYTRARRFRPTLQMLDLARQNGITAENVSEHFHKDVGRTLPVTVRDERFATDGSRIQPRKLPYASLRKDPQFQREVQTVKLLNESLADAGFDFEDTPRLYRLFNRGQLPKLSLNMGGRLYCASENNWQQMPAEERAKITCRGQPTVEIDVQASHLFILYALNGKQLAPGQDPYDIAGIERSVVKGLFAVSAGVGQVPDKWPTGLAKTYKAKTGKSLAKSYKFKSVRGELLSLHPVLHSLKKGKLDWGRLQYEESECFIWAMRNLWDPFKVGALPVHDSLIVAERDKEIAIDFVGRAYEKRFGARPFTRVKKST